MDPQQPNNQVPPVTPPVPPASPTPGPGPEPVAPMGMPQQPQPMQQPQPPKKGGKKLVIIAVIVAVVLLAGAAAAYMLFVNTSKQQSTTDTTNQTTETIDYSDKTVAFRFPSPAPTGWTSTVFDQDGRFQYANTAEGCQVSFMQNKGANDATASGLTAEDSEKAFIEGANSSSVKDFVEVGDAEPFSLKTTVGTTVEFTPKQMTYTRVSDGVNYTTLVGVEWLGDVELFVAPTCKTSDWSDVQDTISSFLSEIEIGVH